MKKCSILLLCLLVAFCLTSCGGSAAKWSSQDVANFQKETSQQTILDRLGEPDRKYIKDDIQVWEYRKPAEKSSAANTYAAIGSYGFMSGANSPYVDILKFEFKNDKVVSFSYEENVGGIIPNTPAKR